MGMIKDLAVESFCTAIEKPENRNSDGSLNWDYVSADIFLDFKEAGISIDQQMIDGMIDDYLMI